MQSFPLVKETSELKKIARNIRIDVLKMLHKAGSGHTGGSLSCVEILTTIFFSKMRHRPEDPKWEYRDRFILSKGHAAPTLYAILARLGYFDMHHLMTLRRLGSILQGHPDPATPGVEVATGSLGQGLSMANGIALGIKLDKKDSRVYVLLGDGEIQEGQVWEAAMSTAHYKLDNICAFVDNNGFQIDGSLKDVMEVEPIMEKWKAFEWNVLKIDGHNFEDIRWALDEAEKIKGKPTVVVARTIKGKGVSIFEKNPLKYHGVAPSAEELKIALYELEGEESHEGINGY